MWPEISFPYDMLIYPHHTSQKFYSPFRLHQPLHLFTFWPSLKYPGNAVVECFVEHEDSSRRLLSRPTIGSQATTMWRRTYLFLLLVRLWFALSSSYLHPDENFQGPEVIAGKNKSFCHIYLFPWRVRLFCPRRNAIEAASLAVEPRYYSSGAEHDSIRTIWLH